MQVINYHGFKDLKVFQLSYKLAMEIFEVSKKFPKEEKYSLTDQIRRSTRSISTNLAEAYRKRIYPKHFISKLSDADSETSETMVWIDFALDCKYIDGDQHQYFLGNYHTLGKMLGNMIAHPEKFYTKNNSVND